MRRAGFGLVFSAILTLQPGGVAVEAWSAVARPLCGQLHYIDPSASTMAVTDEGQVWIVDAAGSEGENLQSLMPGEKVILVGIPGGGETGRFLARSVWRQGRTTAGRGGLHCLRGRVLAADSEAVRLRTFRGDVVTADRSAAVENVHGLIRGERVTVIGAYVETAPGVRSLPPPRMDARFLFLEHPGPASRDDR
jgi:hypothetical protein